MPMKPAKLEKLVLKQGFILQPKKGKGGHRRYEHPDGRTTEIPFHSAEVTRFTESKILQQVGLK